MASAESSNSPPTQTSETKLLSEHQTNIIISEKEAAAAASAAQGTTGFTPKLEWLDTLTTIKKESSYSQNETNSKYIEQYVATLDRFIEKLENRKIEWTDSSFIHKQMNILTYLSYRLDQNLDFHKRLNIRNLIKKTVILAEQELDADAKDNFFTCLPLCFAYTDNYLVVL